MKILFDELGFAQPHGGVSRYFAEMIKRLPSDMEWHLTVKTTNNVYLQEAPFGISKMERSICELSGKIHPARLGRMVARFCQMAGQWLPGCRAFDEVRNRWESRKVVAHGDFDIFHMTDPHPRWNSWRRVVGRKPIVATVHDLIPEIFYPKDFLIRRMRQNMLRDASHIIAVSENTKRDIIKFYGTSPEKISVVYHGYLPVAVPKSVNFKLPSRYILYVGKRTYGKNYDNFREAAIALMRENKGLSLVLTGEPLTTAEQMPYKTAGVLNMVHQRFLTDSEMRYVFAHAAVFVCPSRYEGFGIPILDALSAGCPVVLSDASCLPEVGGDAALYAGIDDIRGLKHQIQKVLDDKQLVCELRKRGLQRAESFSWEKCASETADIYRRVYTEWNKRNA